MKNHISLLDPLRLGAALGVAIFHLMFWSWAWPSIGAADFEPYVAAGMQFPSAARFTWFGWVGVEIFFVVSGFVIANSASNSSATEFLLGRVLRLYPAVWVCATATLIVLLLFASGSATEFIFPYLRAMLLIPKGISGRWIDCVYWTLAAEMAFYGLVFCALLTKKITLRHLAFGLTLYSGVFNAFALFAVSNAAPSETLYLVVLMFRVPGATWLLCHGCFFALGIWLFISSGRKLTAVEWLAVAVTCVSGLAEIYCFSAFMLAKIPVIAGQSPFVPMLVWAIATLFIAIAANRSKGSAAAISPEAAHFLRTLGLLTYPLYLTHNVIGSAIVSVLVRAGLGASLAVGVSLAMLLLFCWFVCAKLEPAIRRLMRNLFSNYGLLPKPNQPSSVPESPARLGLVVPVRAEANFNGR